MNSSSKWRNLIVIAISLLHKYAHISRPPINHYTLFLDNKSPKLASPTAQRRPISIIITPEPGSPNPSARTPTGDRPRSGSLNSPRASNNMDVEDDAAVLKKRAQVSHERRGKQGNIVGQTSENFYVSLIFSISLYSCENTISYLVTKMCAKYFRI